MGTSSVQQEHVISVKQYHATEKKCIEATKENNSMKNVFATLNPYSVKYLKRNNKNNRK